MEELKLPFSTKIEKLRERIRKELKSTFKPSLREALEEIAKGKEIIGFTNRKWKELVKNVILVKGYDEEPSEVNYLAGLYFGTLLTSDLVRIITKFDYTHDWLIYAQRTSSTTYPKIAADGLYVFSVIKGNMYEKKVGGLENVISWIRSYYTLFADYTMKRGRKYINQGHTFNVFAIAAERYVRIGREIFRKDVSL
jgi:hypothetical protein